MALPVIKAMNLHKSYADLTLLRAVEFELMPGTFTTLLGANGAGKSTLMRLIAGTEFPDRGEVTFKGLAVQGWNLPHKKDLFYVNENIQLETSLRMEPFAAKLRVFFPHWHEELFRQMLADRRLPLDRHYHQYSRGQKMQFNLIVALAAQPEILLLDEITSVMDVYARRYFLGMLHRFCQSGRTVLMTTNIISELEYYTTHLLLLQKGELALQGKIEDVKGGFVKLCFPAGSEHPLLRCPWLKWAGLNADGSDNFLLDALKAKTLEIPTEFIDTRGITLEDVFVFHYGEEHAHAA